MMMAAPPIHTVRDMSVPMIHAMANAQFQLCLMFGPILKRYVVFRIGCQLLPWLLWFHASRGSKVVFVFIACAPVFESCASDGAYVTTRAATLSSVIDGPVHQNLTLLIRDLDLTSEA
jgi:hypothetical protein